MLADGVDIHPAADGAREAAVGPHSELPAGPAVAAPTVSRRKWAAPRAVLARPSRSRDISTSPVRVIAPGRRCSRGGGHPPWPVRRSRRSRIQVDGEWCVAGSSAGLPGHGQQLATHPVPTCPHRKLRRKVPRVEGALTTLPRVQAVPPVRSASSMQSPPRQRRCVIILSPVLARPGARPRSTGNLGQAQVRQRGGKDQPGVDQAVVRRRCGCGRVGGVVASIGCSLFRFLSRKPLSQMHRSTFLPIQPAAILIFSVDSG